MANDRKYYNLFARSASGKILTWSAHIYEGLNCTNIKLTYGSVNGQQITRNIQIDKGKGNRTRLEQAILETESRYKSKLQQGYIELNATDYGIYINTVTNTGKLKFLDKLIGNTRIDLAGMGKPMKGQKFKSGIMEYPAIAQTKINGFRMRVSWESWTEGEGMFAETKEGAVARSFDGIRFNLPHITDLFTKEMFEHTGIEIVYDGEVYRPGLKLNEIKKRIPFETKSGGWSKTEHDPKELGFWMFDLAIPDIAQNERLSMLNDLLQVYLGNVPVNAHGSTINNTGYILNQDIFKDLRLVRVGNIVITSDKSAQAFADECIEKEYEGAMIRDTKSDYIFGGRQRNMLKVKRWHHTECEVIDIKAVNQDNIRTYINFTLRNDINNSIFDCNCEGDEAQRQEYISNRFEYIGKLATIKFRERSGKNEVPFQSLVVTVDRKGMGDL